MIDLDKINEDIAQSFELPLRQYSTNRKHSAVVVDKIRVESLDVVSAFDGYIDRVMENIKKVAGKCTPSDFLIFITSLDICEAALMAIRQRNQNASS